MNTTNLIDQFTQFTSILKKSGITTHLPGSDMQGVIGIDGMENPLPTLDQIQELFEHNKYLLECKIHQGFTQLQLTPLAIPMPILVERVKVAIQIHAATARIFRTRKIFSDPYTPIEVNTESPVWIWERVRQLLDSSRMIYFPQFYNPQGHQGLFKSEAITDSHICAIPGCSIGLIEPLAFLPKSSQAQVIGGRQQLETGLSPSEYLSLLNSPQYEGETGWTLEDFLIHFLVRLETIHQVSHDRADDNALWLLGQYLPDLEKTPNLVPAAFWSSAMGKKLYLTTHRTANHFGMCGARTMVRLWG